MADIVLERDRAWTNYHETQAFTVAEHYRYIRGNAPAPDGPALFGASAQRLCEHLGALPGRAAAGLLGRAWSLSDIVGNPARQLELDQLDGIAWVEGEHLHHRTRFAPRQAVFVVGGATWKQVADFVENDRQSPRTIVTSGSYLAQSVAGSIGTATGGSRLGYGGVQNQIIAIHFANGPGRSIWVERASDPVIGHVAGDLCDTVIRNDGVFEDALVHLGGMGLVNGVVVETAAPARFTMLKMTRLVDATWLSWLQAGDYDAIAAWLGYPQAPVYYEVQVDPFAWDKTPAIHTLYFRAEAPLIDTPAPTRPNVPVAGLLGNLGWALSRTDLGAEACTARPAPAANRFPDTEPHPAWCQDMRNALADLHAYYSTCLITPTTPEQSGAQTWGQLHATPPAPSQKALIYSAAFAFSQDRLIRALPIISKAVQGRPRHFLFTLRFTRSAAGTMAYARFPRSVVLDFEGLKVTPEIAAACEESLTLIHRALRSARIAFSPHWAKLGPIDPTTIARGFGPESDPESRIARWKVTRDLLLGAEGKRLFRNAALERWGLA